MATFTPNVTDVFAGVSDFDPDFNRIERMLKIRENNYQQGAKKVKGLYDSVFNSQMFRDQNLKTRDAYLKTISETLNSLSATDLSLPQNQQTATELFNPVLTDQNLTKDISYTRGYYDELSKSDKLKSSSDLATRKRHWVIGDKAMQYQAEEFKNADAKTALSMANPKYVEQVDVVSLSEKLYKDSGISVKEDSINGGYIFTKKNGDAVFPITKSFVETIFSQDSGISNMLRTKAYVQRKDFINQNATKFGGQDKAERFYLENIIKEGSKISQEQLTVNKKDVKKLQDKIESWNKKITTDGIEPGSEEHKQYLQDLESLNMAEQGLEYKKNQISTPDAIDFNNIDEVRQQADNFVTFGNYITLTNQVARLLAYKDAEFTVKVNSMALAQLTADLSLRNSMTMEKIRYDHDLIKLQKEIDAGKYKKGTVAETSTPEEVAAMAEQTMAPLNTPTPTPTTETIVPGTISTEEEGLPGETQTTITTTESPASIPGSIGG